MTLTESQLKQRLERLQNSLARAAQTAGRHPQEVQLLAVTKKQPIKTLLMAIALGLQHFGESYVAEAKEKYTSLREHKLYLHYIGQLQANKTKHVAQSAYWVHSIDRVHIAKRLNNQRPPNMSPLNICLQVRSAEDPPRRGGVVQEQLLPLAEQVASLPQLRLRGLMTIAPEGSKETQAQQHFAQVANMFVQLKQDFSGLDSLSMGMSGDYPQAIAEGATWVRIGSELFGARL